MVETAPLIPDLPEDPFNASLPEDMLNSWTDEQRNEFPDCFRSLDGGCEFQNMDIAEAYYEDAEEAPISLIVTRMFFGIFFPISGVALLFLYYYKLRSKMKLSVVWLQGDYWLGDVVWYPIFLWVSFYIYYTSPQSIAEEISLTEVLFPLWFYFGMLVHCSASEDYGSSATQNRLFKIAAEQDYMMRLAAKLQPYVPNLDSRDLMAEVQSVYENSIESTKNQPNVRLTDLAVEIESGLRDIKVGDTLSMGFFQQLHKKSWRDSSIGRCSHRWTSKVNAKLDEVRDLSCTKDELASIFLQCAQWHWVLPTDRSSHRRFERLKTTGCTLHRSSPQALWPAMPRHATSGDWMIEYSKAWVSSQDIPAYLVAQQLLLGVTHTRTFFEMVKYCFWCILAGLLVLLFVVLCLLPNFCRPGREGFWHTPQSMSARYIFFVWVWFSLQGGGIILLAPARSAWTFSRLCKMHDHLAAMLSPSAAAAKLLPHARFYVLNEVQSWAEIRDYVHFHTTTTPSRQLQWTVAYLLLTVPVFLALMLSFIVQQGDTHQALLNAVILLIALIFCLVLPAMLFQGVLVNTHIGKQISQLSRLQALATRHYNACCSGRQQVQANEIGGTCGPDGSSPQASSPTLVQFRLARNGSYTDLPQIASTLSSMVQDLRFNKRNVVCMLGLDLTVARLASFASVIYSVSFFAYRHFASKFLAVDVLSNMTASGNN